MKVQKNRRIARSEKGSVMMEYLILNLGVIAALVASAHFFVPGSGNYGNLGDAFIAHWNMVLNIVSMPYP